MHRFFQRRFKFSALMAFFIALATPLTAQVDYRNDHPVIGTEGLIVNTATELVTYVCGGGPVCGTFWALRSYLRYDVDLPAPATSHTASVQLGTGLGWSGSNPNYQVGFCAPLSWDDHGVALYNVTHYVFDSNVGTRYLPCLPGDCLCATTVTRIPARGILAYAESNGTFAISDSGQLERRFYLGGWQRQTLPHAGAAPVPGSLIRGSGTGAHANVYGVNGEGELFTTWNDNGTLRYARVPGTQDLVPGSLVLSKNKSVFGITTSGKLVRTYYAAGWHTETIPHYGGALEPGTFVASPSSGNVRGINEHGQLVTTWLNGGAVAFALIPGALNFASVVETTGRGILGVTTSGSLQRVWWSNGGWQVQPVPHTGPALAPASFVIGGGGGSNGSVYGLNVSGQAVAVAWFNNGPLVFAVLPGTLGLEQLAWRDINGLFSIDGAGELRRTYWQAGAWRTDLIPHSGPALVPESLIAGGGQGVHTNVYGINVDGELFVTWNDAGTIRFALVP